jgi:putative endonuclease
MGANAAVGRFGENVAVRYLKDAGLTVLERNWRCREGELDIVAQDGAVLVFCEVKTRRGAGFGTPDEAVTTMKAARLRLLAMKWLAAHRAADPGHYWPELRFDVISVRCAARGPAAVEHTRGAF